MTELRGGTATQTRWHESGHDRTENTRYIPAALLRDIGQRLRRVCADWPEYAFSILVCDVAAIQQKYDARSRR